MNGVKYGCESHFMVLEFYNTSFVCCPYYCVAPRRFGKVMLETPYELIMMAPMRCVRTNKRPNWLGTVHK